MPNIGPMELMLVLAIALIVLGPRRLPEFGRSVGTGMREFKDAITGKEPRDNPRLEAASEQGASPASTRPEPRLKS